jgi:EAL domain-containing protein (putative c-di-GMP-specific phosphodiesterase class I)
MADRLNLRVVAEGVETQAQAELLFSHDCHALQGFLLARPMPIDTWLETVRGRARNDGPAK